MAASVVTARADETCSSPYLARIEGQEEFVYVWTLGVEGLGDGSDKLVVVDVKPGSPSYGKVIHSHSVGGRHEAHHGGFTDDRRQLWLSGLETSKIFIFDVHSQSGEAALREDHRRTSRRVTGGAVGPHGVVCAAGARAHSVSLEREGQRRTHRARRIQQRRRLHRHALAADEGDGGRRGRGVRRRLRLRCARAAAEECIAHLVVHRLEKLHARVWRPGEGCRGNEAVRRLDGAVGFPHAEAEESLQRARRAAGNPLGVGREAQLRLHRHGAHLEALARATRTRTANGRRRKSPPSAARAACCPWTSA